MRLFSASRILSGGQQYEKKKTVKMNYINVRLENNRGHRRRNARV